MSMTIEDPSLLTPIEMTGTADSLLERWRSVARQIADRPAVHSADQSFTFGQLETLSENIASALTTAFRGEGGTVGALVGHDATALIAFLAIIKTGRTIVMLDPHLPAERVLEIIALSGISEIVADQASQKHLDALNPDQLPLNVTMLDPLFARALSGERTAGVPLPPTERAGQDALSIIFTSGSTGKPKGVIHTHAQMLNDAAAHSARYRISLEDRVALVLPIGFSAGLSLTFITLLNGASLWMFDPRDGGTRGLIRFVNENKLTLFHCTPHLLRAVASTMHAGESWPTLRTVATVGEAVFGEDVAAMRPHLDRSATFYNWVGSSETGTFALFAIRGDDEIAAGAVPAGSATANKDIRLVRDDGSRAAAGEAGEIMIFSPFLSGGYWDDEQTNASRFVTDGDGRRGCRQGDLGRIDEDGMLRLLGRADSAVKVRGYLVEPSEIEAALVATGMVQEAAVVAMVDPPAPTRLVAYLVPKPGIRPPSAAALRRELRQRLPEYMVPGAIVQLAALPRNERGKIDRIALPPVPPRNESGEQLDQWQHVVAGFWSRVLELPTIELDDDFHALGGDSLSIEELMAAIKSELGIALVSSDLMEFPTLREFARRLKQGGSALPSHPDVVTFCAEGSQTPMFCFAGSGALALTFLPMSHYFDDRMIYAFQAHGLEARGVPDWSVEGAAQRFLQIIRIVRPHGPYVLVGHSFGGLIALEIARVLEQAGEVVELVTLLDTYYPSSLHEPPSHDFGVIAPVITATSARTTALTSTRDHLQAQVHRILPDGLPRLNLWTRRLRGYLAGVLHHSGQRQFDALFDHGTIVARKYRLAPYSGRSFVVFANDNPDRDLWRNALRVRGKFVDIASEHSSMLREPHAREVADLLQTELSALR